MKSHLIAKRLLAQGTYEFQFELDSGVIQVAAGQYGILEIPGLATANKRVLSFVNAAGSIHQFTVATRISDSPFKQALLAMDVGSEIELVRVGGIFCLPNSRDPLVLIAGGIGITPFMSMIATMARTHDARGITLLYSNRNQEGTAYLPELIRFTQQIPHFRLVPIMTSDVHWTGESRRLDIAVLTEYVPQYLDATILMVGPPPMIDATRLFLLSAGVVPTNIRSEQFAGYD